MVMMTSVTQAGFGFREIPDPGNAACSLMPEASNDQCYQTGTNPFRSGRNFKSCSLQVN
jgi:hypothetical protein